MHLIGHFRVPKPLIFKMRLGAQTFLWKWVLFAWEWKMISILKAEHLPSFWNRGPEELRNGLLKGLGLVHEKFNVWTGPYLQHFRHIIVITTFQLLSKLWYSVCQSEKNCPQFCFPFTCFCFIEVITQRWNSCTNCYSNFICYLCDRYAATLEFWPVELY